ncbi:MAG TPA: patatin-like phospholipase family protein [Acidimicrobiia bacterium]|nr:patatin-like phospholipase family protein [Acidimicrobiia bacterium]
MNADLVLEGGGVKGIGLAGALSALEAGGYEFPRIAGTSAGALLGALAAAGYDASELRELMATIDYRQFADTSLLDRLGALGKSLSVIFEQGVYEGAKLRDWVAEKLAAKGVETFADLRIPDDPASDLPPERRYRLVVMASDVSRGRLARLPWDYAQYGLDPDRQRVADAVRASTSIPFYYEPVRLTGGHGWENVLVDGGMLSNFPIEVFDRRDGKPPRWPTFGVKLSAEPGAARRPTAVDNTFEFAKVLVMTMMQFHDQMHLDDPAVLARTMFVDTLRVRATDFDLDPDTQTQLYDNGRVAAERFLAGWDFDAYVDAFRR